MELGRVTARLYGGFKTGAATPKKVPRLAILAQRYASILAL
jgi:hypothetical protein